MRILSRPMFKYGGPIKEGVMHGMKNGGLSKQFNTGLVGDERYPKTDGREHHVGFLAPLYWGGQAALRFGPAAWRGMKAARTFTPWAKDLGKWGRIKDIFLPRKGVTGPKMKGELWKTPFVPVSAAEKAGFGVGSFARTNPITTIGLASMAPQAGALGYNVGKAGVKALPGALKRYADMVIPGDQSRWWKDKEPPTGVPLNPNLQKQKTIKQEKKINKTIAEIAAEAKAARNAKLAKYLDTMGYDRAQKTAVGKALIDASAIVQAGTEEGGSLKHADWGRMINQAIQATSKRLEKPEQIREAVGLMMTKAGIQKDMTAEADAQAKRKLNLQIKELEEKLDPSVADLALAYGDKTDKQVLFENIVKKVKGVENLKASFKDVKDTTYGDWKDKNKKADAMKFMNDIVKKESDFGAGFYVFPKRIVEVKDDLSMSYYY